MKTPQEQARELYTEFKKDEANPDALLRLVEFMGEYEGDDKIVLSTDLLPKIKELEEEERYMTGIQKLDKILDGFRSNQLIVISAPPKAGKTQFCVHIARSLPNPTMFLFEETAIEVMYKYYKKGLELPRFYTEESLAEANIDQLYRKMIEAWAKYNSRIFFIDHLHFLLDSRDSVSVEIKEVMQSLKKFAKRHNFTIFLVAHITKGSFDQPPGVDAIRDSSFIPQYADTVLMLWRESFKAGVKEHTNLLSFTNNLLVNVALNRKINFQSESNIGLVDLTFKTDTWTYDETNWYTEWTHEGDREMVKAKEVISKLRS